MSEIKNRERITAAAKTAAAHYYSTACMHGKCKQCRVICKYCDEECKCFCHEEEESPRNENPPVSRSATSADADPVRGSASD